MMIVPQELLEEVTVLIPPPTPTTKATPTPTPLPTVKPDPIPLVFTQAATETGHRAIVSVCVIMGISSLIFYYLAARVPVQKRLFHFVTSLITTIAFLSYFAMATGDGIGLQTISVREDSSHSIIEITKRQIYWVRYIDWTLTTPLLLLDLALLAGLSGYNISVIVASDLIMILSGLFASFGRTDTQKWGWYAIACIGYLTILYQLGYKGHNAVVGKDTRTKAFFGTLSLFTLLVWTIYPIVWGVAEGARIASVDGEIVAYAVLDLLAKPVFGFWLLFAHDRNLTGSTLTLDEFWSEGLPVQGAIRVGEGRAHDEE